MSSAIAITKTLEKEVEEVAADYAKRLRRYYRQRAMINFGAACDRDLYEPAKQGKISIGDVVSLPNPANYEATGTERNDYFVVIFVPLFNRAGHLENYGTGLAVRNAHGKGYNSDKSAALAAELGAVLKKLAPPAGLSSNIMPAWGEDGQGFLVDSTHTAQIMEFCPQARDRDGDLIGLPKRPKTLKGEEDTASSKATQPKIQPKKKEKKKVKKPVLQAGAVRKEGPTKKKS